MLLVAACNSGPTASESVLVAAASPAARPTSGPGATIDVIGAAPSGNTPAARPSETETLALSPQPTRRAEPTYLQDADLRAIGQHWIDRCQVETCSLAAADHRLFSTTVVRRSDLRSAAP